MDKDIYRKVEAIILIDSNNFTRRIYRIPKSFRFVLRFPRFKVNPRYASEGNEIIDKQAKYNTTYQYDRYYTDEFNKTYAIYRQL